ncbi:acyl-CoA dehydrogenase family protein [Amycolatopsis sp. cmx-4-68]|uniref:acyl-CoA dehydrogenase family protein n=1 Tax=Amycolatopsis sp. cmx-4-68 TaxID=2790938 RepID=UPI0039786F57
MTTSLLECERTARSAGLAAGLAAALPAGPADRLAPGRYAAVPAAAVPEGAEVRTHSLADREDIVFLACPGRPREERDAHELADFGRHLAAVRLGVLRSVLDHVVEHLSNRTSGDEPLIRKQLIAGAIGDVMAAVERLRAQVRSQRHPVAVADVHRELDELGWRVAQHLGAAGFLATSPARSLYVSALVAGTWVDREPEGEPA